MGTFHADLTLINGIDVGFAKKKVIGEEEIKQINVRALVDTGSYMMAINENIQSILQLNVVDSRKAQLANGEMIDCDVVEGLVVRFQNRSTMCRAMVLPGDAEVLLGMIPLEDMDVLIDPLRGNLIVNPAHPDCAWTRL